MQAVLLEEAGQAAYRSILLSIGGVKCRGALRVLTPCRGQAHISAGTAVRITAQLVRATRRRVRSF